MNRGPKRRWPQNWPFFIVRPRQTRHRQKAHTRRSARRFWRRRGHLPRSPRPRYE
jgi:hypothetical protein